MGVQQLFELSGRVALVTGGSRGLGLQMAQALGEMGCRVALVARKADELAEAEAGLKAQGIEEAPYRQLLGVEIGAAHERDLDDIGGRLADLGVTIEGRSSSLTAVDPISHVRFRVTAPAACWSTTSRPSSRSSTP